MAENVDLIVVVASNPNSELCPLKVERRNIASLPKRLGLNSAAADDQSPEVVDFKLGVADFAVGNEVFVANQLVGTAQ